MRFEVGEMARFVVARTTFGAARIGSLIEVVCASPRAGAPAGDRVWCESADYGVRFLGEEHPLTCMDYQLQKLNPPEEPIEMTQAEECEA